MADSLFADRGRVDDPHLWERAERLGLDLERFDADRRSDAVAARVRRDFESGIRAGVSGHADRASSAAVPCGTRSRKRWLAPAARLERCTGLGGRPRPPGARDARSA